MKKFFCFYILFCSNVYSSYPNYKPNSFIISLDKDSHYYTHNIESNINDIIEMSRNYLISFLIYDDDKGFYHILNSVYKICVQDIEELVRINEKPTTNDELNDLIFNAWSSIMTGFSVSNLNQYQYSILYYLLKVREENFDDRFDNFLKFGSMLVSRSEKQGHWEYNHNYKILLSALRSKDKSESRWVKSFIKHYEKGFKIDLYHTRENDLSRYEEKLNLWVNKNYLDLFNSVFLTCNEEDILIFFRFIKFFNINIINTTFYPRTDIYHISSSLFEIALYNLEAEKLSFDLYGNIYQFFMINLKITLENKIRFNSNKKLEIIDSFLYYFEKLSQLYINFNKKKSIYDLISLADNNINLFYLLLKDKSVYSLSKIIFYLNKDQLFNLISSREFFLYFFYKPNNVFGDFQVKCINILKLFFPKFSGNEGVLLKAILHRKYNEQYTLFEFANKLNLSKISSFIEEMRNQYSPSDGIILLGLDNKKVINIKTTKKRNMLINKCLLNLDGKEKSIRISLYRKYLIEVDRYINKNLKERSQSLYFLLSPLLEVLKKDQYLNKLPIYLLVHTVFFPYSRYSLVIKILFKELYIKYGEKIS